MLILVRMSYLIIFHKDLFAKELEIKKSLADTYPALLAELYL